MIYKFQKIPQTSKNHSKSTITPNAKFYIWKMIRKIQSIHLYWFHAYLSKLTWCLVQNKIKHLEGPCMSLKLESLIQNGSNPSGFSCISPTHSYCHVSCMHHIVAHCLVMAMYRCSLRQVLPPRSTVITLAKNRIRASIRQASNPLIISIQTHLLACALIYCIKTTRFKLLCVAVVEPTFLCMTCHCHGN